jgi:hypothetical protein
MARKRTEPQSRAARTRAKSSATLPEPGIAPAPDQTKLNAIAAGRLASLTGLEANELQGQTIASISEKLKWAIDPEWLLFRRVCGRVVQTDPISGIAYPVPFATVQVLDTECDFWGYFPERWLYSWLFPVRCRTEELAEVVTDECGNFCVWIPRFEIEWILRWRRERLCWEEFLVKPSIADLLARLAQEVAINPKFPPPNPGDPWELAAAVAERGDLTEAIGKPAQQAIASAARASAFGSQAAPVVDRLAAPAFPQGLEPPLPHTLKERFTEVGHEALVDHIKGESLALEGIDLARWVGPFLRCVDIWVREWEPIFEVPDISFEVTQDVDGDGNPDVIYRSYFDLSYGGADPYVTIEASQIAVALRSPVCVPSPPCDEGDVAIQRAGLMPIESAPAYFDASSGFGVRPNKPRPGGLFGSGEMSPSTAPFFGELQLYGCVHAKGAAYYRILGATANGNGIPTPGSAAFGPAVPMIGSWKLARWAPGFQQHTVSPDPAGWYEILPDSDDWQPEHLLLDWVTASAGVWQLTLELGNAGKSVIYTAPPVTMTIDNFAPTSTPFPTLFQWRYAGTSGWTNLLTLPCPLITRKHVADIEIQIGATVASGHLRSALLSAGGCGLTLVEESGNPAVTQHWYENKNDNSWSTIATYTVPADAPAGCYAFSFDTTSRAFNPAGSDGGYAADWNYDNPWPLESIPSVSVAVVGP